MDNLLDRSLVWQEYQPIAIIACTPQAVKMLTPLCQSMNATLWVSNACAVAMQEQNLGDLLAKNCQVYDHALKEHLALIWPQYKSLIFGLATGAVVRLIAPLLTDKATDPAVIVIDELGKFAISLLGGHQGGADRLSQLISTELNATPIITGVCHHLNLPAIDTLGIPFGWQKGAGHWNEVAAVIARGEPVEILQEAGNTWWQNSLPPGHNLVIPNLGVPTPGDDNSGSERGETSINFDPSGEEVRTKARVWIGFTQRQFAPTSEIPKVQWHPRVLWVGIGCERGTSEALIDLAIHRVCQSYHLAIQAIAGIATIDIKADEIGLITVCQKHNWPLKTFPATMLKTVAVPTPSDIVNQEVGTPSVAEAAAILGANTTRALIINDDKLEIDLIVPKQVFRQVDEPGAVTVAIALSLVEYTNRIGTLYLTGIGPGAINQITPAAQTAIKEADVIIGYGLYIDLISSLLRPGQIVENYPLTQEKQRCERAINLAKCGLTVAVISSGDCGIYGMAGLVFEQLQQQNWDGVTPRVEVFPGISALQSTAARVGAPLMHDFCAISLSDLLTPWEVIENRLKAAAIGDFVTIIYNPKSANRTQQIVTAQQIFLEHRKPTTPVAIARSVYRQDEQITLTTLAEMLDHHIDMLTTVIIGNSNTFSYHHRMVTPRGYLISNLMT